MYCIGKPTKGFMVNPLPGPRYAAEAETYGTGTGVGAASVTIAPPVKFTFCVNVKVELAKSISVTKLVMKVAPKMVVFAAFA